MTREEAKRRMEICRNFLANNYSDMGEPNFTAFNMAIQALSQEPSREFEDYENEIEDLHNRLDIAEYDKERLREEVTNLEAKIQALEQEPCDDAISREWLKTAIHNFYYGLKHTPTEEDIQAYIDVAPSVTQKSESVTELADRCRECGKMRKGHWIWNFDKGYCKCSECGIGMGHKEFDYCPNCGAKMESEG